MHRDSIILFMLIAVCFLLIIFSRSNARGDDASTWECVGECSLEKINEE